jgi:Tfp pilus assembly protein PilN
MRDSVSALQQRVEQVEGLKGKGPGITAALFDLAMLLPEDAHLKSLHATGDTLVLEAAGSRAGLALEAVRASAALRDVRLKGTVERELESGETTAERFTFAARLGWRDSAEAKPPGAAKSSATRAARNTVQGRSR